MSVSPKETDPEEPGKNPLPIISIVEAITIFTFHDPTHK